MKLIDKDALVAEIERRKQVAFGWLETTPSDAVEAEFELCDDILSFINTLEVKEVDLKKEFNKYFFNFTDPETGEKLKRKECWLDIKQARKLAKHFFELGLKVNQKGE